MPPFTLLTSHVWTLFSTMIWSHLLFWFEFRLDFYRFSQLFDSLPNLVQLFPKKRQNWYWHSILFPSKSNQNKLKFFVFQAIVGLNLAEHHEQSLFLGEFRYHLQISDQKREKKHQMEFFLGFSTFQVGILQMAVELFNNFLPEFGSENQMASTIAFTLLQRHFRSIEFSRGNIRFPKCKLKELHS